MDKVQLTPEEHKVLNKLPLDQRRAKLRELRGKDDFLALGNNMFRGRRSGI